MFVYLNTLYAAIVNFLLPSFVYLNTQNAVTVCMSRKLFLQYEKLGILCNLLGWIHEVFMVKKQKQSNKYVFYHSLTFLKKVICIPTVKTNFMNMMIHRVTLKIVKNMMRVKMKVQQILFLILLKVRKYVIYTRWLFESNYCTISKTWWSFYLETAIYMAMLFLLFEQQNGIQKRGQWFGERKKVRKFKGKILFSLEKFMKTMMAPF